MTKLIVFLGNPGREYERTRHNVGWMIGDALSFAGQLAWKGKFKGLVASYGGRLFLKPTGFMNRSGESVGPCAAFYRISPPEILVAHDDMELSFGRMELRKGGGLGGHNGLKDIARVLGSRDFDRLRFGISHPATRPPAKYVLERFTPEEEAELPALLDRAVAFLEI